MMITTCESSLSACEAAIFARLFFSQQTGVLALGSSCNSINRFYHCVNITIIVRVKSTDRFNSNKKSSSALHLSENMALLVDRLSLLLFFQHCNCDDKQPPPSKRCPQTTLVAFFGFPLAAFPPTGPTPWNFFWANVVFLPGSSSSITFILCLNSSTTCFSFERLRCTRSATWWAVIKNCYSWNEPSSKIAPSWNNHQSPDYLIKCHHHCFVAKQIVIVPWIPMLCNITWSIPTLSSLSAMHFLLR